MACTLTTVCVPLNPVPVPIVCTYCPTDIDPVTVPTTKVLLEVLPVTNDADAPNMAELPE